MIQIGRYKFGIAPLSMIIVFILLSVCTIVMALHHARLEWPMPLRDLIFINEGLALLVTLVSGIILHLAIIIIYGIRNRNQS
ncbi:hypothetical protein [Sangeribacter muris]|jgi:hypothetical protein|uniref:hypothetical protein n=2 Tax=Muribaculaceae TaxID=2005473 RepID=UPI00244E31A6|nr:hypothetical protein [Sangeribacter muris]